VTGRLGYSLPETRAVIEALTAVHLERGLSQEDLAELMGADQSWLCGVETGRVPDPRFSTVVRLARALGVTASLTIYDARTGDSWVLPITPDQRTAV
jgi:transcriptional regulator with XRE-family HTH domain